MLIVDAAAGLFVSEGYARTTVRAIAGRAGVAPDTVYAVFGSKVGVLTAVLNARLAPSGEVSVMDRPESRAVRDEPDQRRQLHRFAHDMAGVSARIRPIYEVLRTAGAVEPEVGEVFAELERHRLAHIRQLAGWFARRGPLRVSRDRAAEILWVLASPDVARMLCDVRGVEPDPARRVAGDHALLRSPARKHRSRLRRPRRARRRGHELLARLTRERTLSLGPGAQ